MVCGQGRRCPTGPVLLLDGVVDHSHRVVTGTLEGGPCPDQDGTGVTNVDTGRESTDKALPEDGLLWK